MLLTEQHALVEEVKTLRPAIEALPDKLSSQVVAEVDSMLERRAMGTGHVTQDIVKGMITEFFNASPLTAAIQCLTTKADSILGAQPPTRDLPSLHDSTTHLFMIDGRMRRVPQDFQLPVGTALVAWQHYCCPNTTKGYPALRFVEQIDIVNEKLKKRFSAYKILMSKLEREAKRKSIWIEDSTVQQATDMFSECFDVLEVKHVSRDDRVRRISQLHWSTVERDSRLAKKAK
jgi:hypothetical protein